MHLRIIQYRCSASSLTINFTMFVRLLSPDMSGANCIDGGLGR